MPFATARRATRTALGLSLLALTLAAAPSAQIVINEVLYDPPGASGDLSGDANGDGTRSSPEDEFIEIVNAGSAAVDISGYTLSDDDATGDQRFSFPAGTTLGAGQAAILFGGGTPTGTFGGAQTFVDDGTIGTALGNGGDVIELRDAAGTLVSSVGYGSAGPVAAGNDQSIARNPDVTGDFVDHTTITTNAVLFSAGLQNATGAAFGSTDGGGGDDGALVVTTSADETTTNGQCSLREAVRASNGDTNASDCGVGTDGSDTITFAPTVNSVTLTLGEITITDGVTIDGSTAGGKVTIDAGRRSRVFDVNTGDNDDRVRFTSLVLQNGDASQGGSAAPNAGGGVDLKSGSAATFTNVDVTDSFAGVNGGGIHGAGDTDIVITATDGSSSLIARNVAAGDAAGMGGGGVWGAGSVTITGPVLISGNRATGASGSGGGVFNFGGTLAITGATISNNTAIRAGGGIEDFGDDDDDVDVTLTDVTLIGNTFGDTVNPGNGGGLHSGGGEVVVNGGLVRRNIAIEGGGLWTSGTLTVTGTSIRDNVATGPNADNGGGGLYSDGGTIVLTDVGVLQNTATGAAGSGGGLLNAGGTLTVTGGFFTRNSANRAGGGVESAGGTVTLNNSRLTQNDAGTSPGNGGGLHGGGDAQVTVTNTWTGSNTAVEGGGLWISQAGTLTVVGGTVQENTASGDSPFQGGGGLYSDGGTLVVRGTMVKLNAATGEAGSGGGILNYSGDLTVTDADIRENTSNRAGGGIEVNAARPGSLGATATISDSRIAENNAGTSPGNGGGLHAGGAADLTFSSVRFEKNQAVEGGGFWINGGGMLTASGLVVRGNQASGDDAENGGGGFYNDGGRATIEESVFDENRATGTSGSGGAILNNMGMVEVRSTVFSDNRANRAGGAIEDRAGSVPSASMVALVDVDMVENNAGSNPGNGGALHITGAGLVTIDSSRVTRNVAANEGGGLWNSSVGSLTATYTEVASNTANVGAGLYQQGSDADNPRGVLIFRNGAVAENVAKTAGGGLAVDGATVQIVNSSVAANLADVGAGIVTRGGRLLLSSATVAWNVAQTAGGGVANVSAGDDDDDDSNDPAADSLSVSPDNTIFDENRAPQGANILGPIMSRGYNLFETTAGGVVFMAEAAGDDITGVDAGTMRIADNGGPTRSVAIREDSPAVNNGRTALEIDQRGVERRLTPDIGAFETGAAPTPNEGFETEFADGELMKMSPVAPNPFRGRAVMSLAVRQSQTVRVALYDVMGRQVRVLHEGPVAGSTALDVEVDANGLASGVYVIVVRGETVQGTQRITVTR